MGELEKTQKIGKSLAAKNKTVKSSPRPPCEMASVTTSMPQKAAGTLRKSSVSSKASGAGRLTGPIAGSQNLKEIVLKCPETEMKIS